MALLFLAFILAASVMLEITGETSDTQFHFSISSTSGSPVGGSCSSTSTSASSTCEATANGYN